VVVLVGFVGLVILLVEQTACKSNSGHATKWQIRVPQKFGPNEMVVRISGDITVNFGPKPITMIKLIQTTQHHTKIDKVNILTVFGRTNIF
jgi:hypothetical protein